MLTVHHLGISQSERIVWLCEELEIPYDFIRYERTSINLTPPAYRATNTGTSTFIWTVLRGRVSFVRACCAGLRSCCLGAERRSCSRPSPVVVAGW